MGSQGEDDMSELLEIFRKEESKYREFVDLKRRLQAEVRRARELEREVEQILEKAKIFESGVFLDFVQEAVKITPEDMYIFLRHRHRFHRVFWMDILRAIKKWENYLETLLKACRGIHLPEPPPMFLRKPVEREMELPLGQEIRRVWVQDVEVRIDGEIGVDEGVVVLSYQDGGKPEREVIRGLRDLPLLLALFEPISELLNEAMSLYQTYASELEGFKRKITSEYHREILMQDL
jgi:hypothetical protein